MCICYFYPVLVSASAPSTMTNKAMVPKGAALHSSRIPQSHKRCNKSVKIARFCQRIKCYFIYLITEAEVAIKLGLAKAKNPITSKYCQTSLDVLDLVDTCIAHPPRQFPIYFGCVSIQCDFVFQPLNHHPNLLWYIR